MRKILGFVVLLMFIVPSQDSLAGAPDMEVQLAAAANSMDIAIDVDLDCAETVTAPLVCDGRLAWTTECETANLDELDVREAALNVRPPPNSTSATPLRLNSYIPVTTRGPACWIFVVSHVSDPLLC
jgi:hypothetical protein